MTESSGYYSGDGRDVSLAKALKDSGFDVVTSVGHGWLRGASLSSPLVVHARWKGGLPELSLPRLSILAPALAAAGGTTAGATATSCEVVSLPPEPAGAVGSEQAKVTEGPTTACSVPSLEALHLALAAAFRATRNIGLLPAHEAFQLATSGLPRNTEAERMVVQRVGQQLFREALEKRSEGRCAVTGLSVSELLRASHIKPWARCTTDAERLDPNNGLLLAVNWDAVFDRGLVTFDPDGRPVWSELCPEGARQALGLISGQLSGLTPEVEHYLGWHRAHVFRDPFSG